MTEPKDGFADIRWTDSRDAVVARFEGARELSGYDGRNPRTNERVVVHPTVVLDKFPPAPIAMTTAVSFDLDDQSLRQIEVSVTSPDMTGWRDAEWDQFHDRAIAMLRELATRLRLDGVSVEVEHQTWTVDGVQIGLELEVDLGAFRLRMQRASSLHEPKDGFEGIRWTDSIDSIAVRFAGRVRQTASYEGRNPRTGERVHVGPGISIDDLPAAPIRLTTMIDFGEHGIRELSVLAMPVDMLGWNDAEWDRFNAGAAEVLRELARRLRLDGLSVELQEQTWTIDGVEIVLGIDTGPGDFTLMMRPPAGA